MRRWKRPPVVNLPHLSMKTDIRSFFVFASLWLVSVATAAPLTGTTAVHVQPAGASPVITYFKAGTEPTPSNLATDMAPEGWQAVSLPGPHEGYVQNKDLTKALDVSVGVAIHISPDPASAVIATSAPGDKTTITGLQGKWTQIRLDRELVGYIQAGGSNAPLPAPRAYAAEQNRPSAPSIPPAYSANNAAGKPVTMVDRGDGGSSALPRSLQGVFVSSRSLFSGRQPYDFALNDDSGKRYAYLDITKLLLTEQIDKYIDHGVVVYGTAKNIPASKEIVIMVESMQLR